MIHVPQVLAQAMEALIDGAFAPRPHSLNFLVPVRKK
jgi:hypothetical protein